MKQSVIGIILGVILLFISMIILPTYFMSVITYRDDLNKAQVASRNFVDSVIDNGKISDRAISDLNLELAACTSTFTYKIVREEKIVQPIGNTGKVETTWMVTEITDDTQWASGDIVTIVIEQQGLNLYQKLAMLMPGAWFHTQDVRMSGMVR